MSRNSKQPRQWKIGGHIKELSMTHQGKNQNGLKKKKKKKEKVLTDEEP